jgi:two-component system, NtrC family, sensor kinase
VSAEKPRSGRGGTVARRLFSSYLVLLVAYGATLGLGLRDLRAAAAEAELLRSAYVPLLLHVGQALAEQNVLGAQLNHVTAAKNPADVREWIDTARRARPLSIAQLRRGAQRLGDRQEDAEALRATVSAELDELEASMQGDGERFARLFELLALGDRPGAERAQAELVRREAEVGQRLRRIRDGAESSMARISQLAREREQRSLRLLVGLSALTLLVGVALSLYARRVLRPLEVVTRRAETVARGDLAPREPVAEPGELGELSRTFEAMVAAIRNARSELVKAERLATVGKMAAHITHEIRNPLSAIGLNLELLESELADGQSESIELLTAIKSETARLSRLSEQYLSMARRPQPVLASEDVGDLVREVLVFIEPELARAKVELRTEIEEGLAEVALDETLVRQALLNLVRNAREAMPDGGHIVVGVRGAAGGGIDIVVEDDGPGIPEELRASIFDAFFTTKQRGTGLGLAMTREIVEAHHGSIACEPRTPRGTRFVLHLPSEPAPSTSAVGA